MSYNNKTTFTKYKNCKIHRQVKVFKSIIFSQITNFKTKQNFKKLILMMKMLVILKLLKKITKFILIKTKNKIYVLEN